MRSEVTQLWHWDNSTFQKCSSLWILICVPGSTTFQSQHYIPDVQPRWCASLLSIPAAHPRCISPLCISDVQTHCASQICNPTMHPRCASQMCISDVHLWYASQIHIPAAHPRYTSPLCIPDVHPWYASKMCIPDVHPRCASPLCIPDVYSRCAFLMCIPDVHSRCAFPLCSCSGKSAFLEWSRSRTQASSEGGKALLPSFGGVGHRKGMGRQRLPLIIASPHS